MRACVYYASSEVFCPAHFRRVQDPLEAVFKRAEELKMSVERFLQQQGSTAPRS